MYNVVCTLYELPIRDWLQFGSMTLDWDPPASDRIELSVPASSHLVWPMPAYAHARSDVAACGLPIIIHMTYRTAVPVVHS